MKRIALSILAFVPGVTAGILLLEPVFRSNTTLLPRGIAAPLPVDPPLTDRWYEVRYTDADIFYWQSGIILPPEEDLLEAVVHWRTDEFGFPNPAPVPAQVDLVVLGRSYAMGAQAEEPWPSLLRGRGYRVLNLSQTGAGIREKRDFLTRFGLPRNPKYAVIEIIPPKDILEFGPAAEPLVVQRAAFPFAQTALRRLFPLKAGGESSGYVYPLWLEWPGGGCDCVFYSGYLAALSLSREDWAASAEWAAYRNDLAGLIAVMRAAGVVPILLYVPTKETVYPPLVSDPASLAGATAAAGSWVLEDGVLRKTAAGTDPRIIQSNSIASAELIQDLGGELSVCVVDPTAAFTAAGRSGTDPFMRYDSHWSAAGHALTAGALAAAMDGGNCR
ncbi:MAG: hypothetical protein JW748_14115 [Anaerolineales bacterium]|nr:hypothetical protein [Anaerolineales bacterium]